MEIKINCLKWGSLYGPEYVNRTYGGLLKHCKEPFHFVCYTDNADGITVYHAYLFGRSMYFKSQVKTI